MTREQIVEVLSQYYGALTQTAIDHIANEIVALQFKDAETVEWGVKVTAADPDYTTNTNVLTVADGKRESAEQLIARSPKTRTAVTRVRRVSFVKATSEWVEVK